ncbi:hypothetical protein BJ322DRAFT_254158 [Thelephora terrestris]|uniref:Uncharacterized protein n=1 Tax=Thelephora terrestris TaxID=56493 RepID=A0A9P6H7S2_9AGAM|nr:hypothetical protein BJ322DRAFT_254158 [Thelephora terrestris]
MSTLRELGYSVIHLYRILVCWSYEVLIRFAYRFLYRFFSPGTKAYLDHEYKIIRHRKTLTPLTRLRKLCSLFQRPDGLFYIAPPTHSNAFSPGMMLAGLYRTRADRIDTPFAAFLRIVHNVHLLYTSTDITITLYNEIESFWGRGITGASKFDYFLFGGRWFIKDIPDPRGELKNDPLLCAIAASTAEQMVEVFNWRIGLGIRRDLTLLRARKPYWDKNLAPCVMESVPEWCKDVGPAPVQTVVDCEHGKDTARNMLESKAIGLSPSFKKRNLLADSQFMYFA